MTYLVLFNSNQTVQGYQAAGSYTFAGVYNQTITYLSMEAFDDEQLAVDFAKKYDGYIVIPATIQSKVTASQPTNEGGTK